MANTQTDTTFEPKGPNEPISFQDLVLEKLDDDYKKLFEETRDTTKYLGKTIPLGSEHIIQQIKKLDDLNFKIDSEFEKDIIACHANLLRSTRSVSLFHQDLEVFQKEIGNIKHEMMNISEEFTNPYNELQADIDCLKRVLSLQDLIKKLQQFLDAEIRLNQLSNDEASDLVKKSSILKEMKELLDNQFLQSIPLLNPHITLMDEQFLLISDLVTQNFSSALNLRNKLDLSICYECMHNLDIWDDTLKKTKENAINRTIKSLENPKGTQIGTPEQRFQSFIKMFESFTKGYTIPYQEILMIDLISSNKDNKSVIIEPSTGPCLAFPHSLELWKKTMRIYSEKIKEYLSFSKEAQKIWVNQYHKYDAILSQFLLNLKSYDMLIVHKEVIEENQLAELTCLSDPIKTEYLFNFEKSLISMADLLFPSFHSRSPQNEQNTSYHQQGILPTLNDTQAFANKIMSQIYNCSFSTPLMEQVIKRCNTAIQRIADRMEFMIIKSALHHHFLNDEDQILKTLPSLSAAEKFNGDLLTVATSFRHFLSFDSKDTTSQLHLHLSLSPFEHIENIIIKNWLEDYYNAILKGCFSLMPGQISSAKTRNESFLYRLSIERINTHFSREFSAYLTPTYNKELIMEIRFKIITNYMAYTLLISPFNENCVKFVLDDISTLMANPVFSQLPRSYLEAEKLILQSFRFLVTYQTATLETFAYDDFFSLPPSFFLLHLFTRLSPEFPRFLDSQDFSTKEFIEKVATALAEFSGLQRSYINIQGSNIANYSLLINISEYWKTLKKRFEEIKDGHKLADQPKFHDNCIIYEENFNKLEKITSSIIVKFMKQ